MKYQVITKDGRAKRAVMETVHGTIQTPVFMNVGTVGAIKELFPQMTCARSALRWNCPIHTISMCVLAIS